MNKVKQLWKFLDGKKTIIAEIFWFFTQVILPIWFVDGFPSVMEKSIVSVGAFLTFVGLGHKAVKRMENK